MTNFYRILHFFILFVIVTVNPVVGQQIIPKDSIIYLDEVIIQNNRAKEVNLKTKNSGKESRGFQIQNSKFVSLIRGIPKGQLNSITFYFNTSQVPEKTEYELGLLIFEIDENGKPGKQISDKDIRFKLKSGKKAKTVLNLKNLNLDSQENLFFGIEVLSDLRKMPLIIDFYKSKSSRSYYTQNNGDMWKMPKGVPVQLKFLLQIIEDK